MNRPALPTATQFRRWGIDPAWSRLIDVPGADGGVDTWHVLDTGPVVSTDGPPPATIVCVHGNPTWSVLWRSFLQRLGDRYRVIAVDQLGMGFSDRTGRRRFSQRVDDLGNVIEALQIEGPVVIAAHDWGGPISLGWVLANRPRVRGIVLCNTGVSVPAGRRAPGVIRLAATGPITALVGHRTRIFVNATLRLSGKRISRVAREAYRAPYRRAARRRAIAGFVDDIPFSAAHPSARDIGEVAEDIRSLTMPVMLAWGSTDPVFNDDFALDLAERMPHADRHRFPGMGHLVVEETDIAGLVDDWLDRRLFPATDAPGPPPAASLPTDSFAPIWTAVVERATDPAVAFVDGTDSRSTTFAELHERIMGVAGGLGASGVGPGDRVAVLVPPGLDLLTTVYGCWRAGAVTVIADRGLGLGGLGAAVRAAHVQWVVGPPKAIAAARALRWAPKASFIAVGKRRALGAVATLDQLVATNAELPPEPTAHDVAAVAYTSGATGPAKGVRYRHGQIAAQRDALREVYAIRSTDRLVAAFAPFALYGPALGIPSTIPDVDVAAPGSLTAEALSDAVGSIDATIVFASPAALANVNRTAAVGGQRLRSLRLVLSAGAPVPIATLVATAKLCPSAELHTPYGMTECLPVTDVELGERVMAGSGAGVCVGRPVSGVEILIAPLDFDAGGTVAAVVPGSSGEVLVRAPWVSDGYDQLWRIEHQSRPRDVDGAEWHRSGDVGRIDADGRLWIEGRTVHVVHTVDGAVTPVPVEVAVEQLDGVVRAAAVGVGPRGCQQLIVVVEDPAFDDGIADAELTRQTRAVVAKPVAAVLTVGALPVDIRHNTKIDRIAVGTWAAAVLAGNRVKRPW